MHSNALVHEKSPYLQQHAHNPVEWLPWGDTAFEKARREDKPIFLSVGYSTCHWCHVMAHESFEDERTAEILNRDFVAIKLDREERPDVDRIYMLFVQATTGSGGWPMSVFLTPDLKPFFGGTYFPPDSRYGRPGFRELLEHLARVWKTERERVESSGASIARQLQTMAEAGAGRSEPDREAFHSAFWQLRRAFDATWGGFGGAPKFPRPVSLNYLMRYYAENPGQNEEALDMVKQTLHAMAAGGMHDQLGGGFHRYSVDERWFVPHFEKMLYDQAQLAAAYLEAYQATRDDVFAATARRIFEYLERDMKDASGAFFSAEDADSPDPEHPGHNREGAFYVWRKSEIDALLATEAELFCKRFGIEPDGNVQNDPQGEFRGQNILYQAADEQDLARLTALPVEGVQAKLAEACALILAARTKRPRPHLDNKILTAWNALTISAFAKGFVALSERRWLDSAENAASFLLRQMYDPASGRVLRRYSEGEAGIPGFLDDYAFLAQALLDLFEATGNAEYLKISADLATRGFERFEDREDGGFYASEEDAPDLLLRLKEDYDGAEPSGNSIAIDVLLRLAHLTGEKAFAEKAGHALSYFTPRVKLQPTMAPQLLVAVGRSLTEPEQVIVRCAAMDAQVEKILAEYRSRFRPYALSLAVTDIAAGQLKEIAPFLAGLERKGNITMYECKNFVCELPKVIGAASGA